MLPRGGKASGTTRKRIKLFLVTGNAHKLEEVRDIARMVGAPIVVEQASIPKREIQSNSLEEIALYAARHAYDHIRKPVIVDDSGLFIDALNGFPGPYSSYVYKTLGVNGILKLMSGIANRRACFRTSAALIFPPLELLFTGETCGYITSEARGGGGFGFDPIFVPEGREKTYAEMSLEEKNMVSHRYKAFIKLFSYVLKMLE